jgi:hypothetical protein
MTPELRAKMGNAAVTIGKLINCILILTFDLTAKILVLELLSLLLTMSVNFTFWK